MAINGLVEIVFPLIEKKTKTKKQFYAINEHKWQNI